MNRNLSILVLLVLVLGASTLPAQIAVGDKAPIIEVKDILSDKVKNLKEFRGSLILYDFFAHW